MSTAEVAKPFHLTGNFAPVFEENTCTDLKVTGSIPSALRGRFFRNGSNPQSGYSDHWFLGNGMIHGIELADGKANWYRNRYVQTPLYQNPDEERSGRLDWSLANTHVISHAGHILALEEGSLPFEVSKDLETVGRYDFDGKLQSNMTAHPRVCPKTGELLFFGYGAVPPYLTYHRVSADGQLVQSEEITVKGPTMMHDWNITENYVIWMDLPMVFDLEVAMKGGIPIRWSDDYGARLGVMPRNGTDKDVTWYEIEDCYVFHPMNAYEDGNKIVIDTSRFKKLAFSPADGKGTPAVLHRWVIDTEKGTVSEQPIDDRPADFPRVPDALIGQKHRYGYMAGFGNSNAEMGKWVYKYDLQTGSETTADLGDLRAGEPVFAADPNGTSEDDGWILSFVYDPNRDASDLIILDASNFSNEPVARVHLPVRVPYGFHGSWIPDE